MTQNNKSAMTILLGALVGLIVAVITNRMGYFISLWWIIPCMVIGGAIAVFAIYRSAIALYTLHSGKRLAALFTGLKKTQWFLPAIGCLIIMGLIIGTILVSTHTFGHKKNIVADKEELAGVLSSLIATMDAHMDSRLTKLATKEEVARLEHKEASAKLPVVSGSPLLTNVTTDTNSTTNIIVVTKNGTLIAKVIALPSQPVVMIGGNNSGDITIGSAVVNAEHPHPTRSPEQCQTAGHTVNETRMFPAPAEYIGAYVDCQLTLDPGEYKEFVMPLRCHLDLYKDNANIQQFINGSLYVPEVCNPHTYIIRNYGLLNRSNWPATIRIRLTRICI